MKKLIRLIVGCLAAINVFILTAFAAIPSPGSVHIGRRKVQFV